MGRFKFGVCEFSFPCWGPLALQMAHEAGFTGMQLADAGGSTNSYPLNNKRVQESYLEASVKSMVLSSSPSTSTRWSARTSSGTASPPRRDRSAWRASERASLPPRKCISPL